MLEKFLTIAVCSASAPKVRLAYLAAIVKLYIFIILYTGFNWFNFEIELFYTKICIIELVLCGFAHNQWQSIQNEQQFGKVQYTFCRIIEPFYTN